MAEACDAKMVLQFGQQLVGVKRVAAHLISCLVLSCSRSCLKVGNDWQHRWQWWSWVTGGI